MGLVEREIRDRAAETLVEMPDLEVRHMFSGFGFYLKGLLVAAAWDGAFRLRYRERGRWVYKAVPKAAIDDPQVLIPMLRDRADCLLDETRGSGGGSGSVMG
jgi:TfoX/Sxy family transcriptional regulator of competence genes